MCNVQPQLMTTDAVGNIWVIMNSQPNVVSLLRS